MNKPNFQTMNQAELRAYVLAHREDTEAFYALVDRLKSKPGRKLSESDLKRIPEILTEIKQKRQA
ncbi:DUF6887 family protein [Crocosphaera chwakensis]|uniref:Uncharacterized protein n=1 Tax=Crocosphaera chwakensis CCY0110 TaxID=391612 RepID=A3IXH0_9CHRO|nr:hypothetical protein [Crocosphaera chwakensis]EAZ88817.1 hypothetical protein CY0110_11882 [Crocosphaera chwakensis CCY0110]